MKASEVIKELQRLQEKLGNDPEVIVQSRGCCFNGHGINKITMGSETYRGIDTKEEVGSIVIRV